MEPKNIRGVGADSSSGQRRQHLGVKGKAAGSERLDCEPQAHSLIGAAPASPASVAPPVARLTLAGWLAFSEDTCSRKSYRGADDDCAPRSHPRDEVGVYCGTRMELK